MKKLVIVFLSIMLLLLSACSKEEDSRQTNSDVADNKIKIGMSFDSFVIERWQRDRDVFVSTAKELGAEVNVQNANGDINKQIEQIEYFIKKGEDVIVIVCIDSSSLKEVVEKAKSEGIKIIAYDRMISEADADLYITFDNEMVGTLMGEALVDKGIAEGNVLMLGGSPTDNNVALVEEGFLKVCESNNINVIDSIHCDGWRAELAAEYIYNNEDMILNADAIMCGNDNLAGQVINALSERRLAGDIVVVGQDADLEACQNIVTGTQTMTVYKPVEKLAKRAAECAIMLTTDGKLEGEDITTIFDGKNEIPYIGLPPIAVNKENMDEIIIDSGFHLKEEVYSYR